MRKNYNEIWPDTAVRQQALKAIHATDDPQATMKKYLMVLHLSRSKNIKSSFVHDNFQQCLDQYFNKPNTSLDEAYNYISEFYRPMPRLSKQLPDHAVDLPKAVAPKEEGGYFEKTGYSLAKGSLSIIRGAINSVKMLNDINNDWQRSLVSEIAPPELMQRVDSVVQTESDRVNHDLKHIDTGVQYLQQKTNPNGLGIIEAFQQKGFAEGMENLSLSIVEQVPQLLLLFTGAGSLPAIASTAAGNKYADIKDDESVSQVRQIQQCHCHRYN